MSKTKCFLLAAGISLAMAFTFSCGEVGGGDDGPKSSSSNGNGACYTDDLVPGVDVALCMTSENGQPITKDFCSYVLTLLRNEGYELELAFRNSCPPNHRLRCEKGELVAYYYGSYITPNITCKMLGGE